MKITKQQLQKIIKEELQYVLKEIVQTQDLEQAIRRLKNQEKELERLTSLRNKIREEADAEGSDPEWYARKRYINPKTKKLQNIDYYAISNAIEVLEERTEKLRVQIEEAAIGTELEGTIDVGPVKPEQRASFLRPDPRKEEY